MYLRLEARLVERLQRAVIVCAATLVGLALLAQLAHMALDLTARGAWGFVYYQLSLNTEANLPTWFASTLLALCGALAWIIAAADDASVRPWRRQWTLLGFAFLFLSLDESSSLHERASAPLRELLGPSELLTNAWVIVGLPLAALFAAWLLPFLRALPAPTRKAFVVSGAVYVAGAAGVEVLSGVMRSRYGMDDPRFALCTWLEESLELAGMCGFLYGAADRLIAVYQVR